MLRTLNRYSLILLILCTSAFHQQCFAADEITYEGVFNHLDISMLEKDDCGNFLTVIGDSIERMETMGIRLIRTKKNRIEAFLGKKIVGHMTFVWQRAEAMLHFGYVEVDSSCRKGGLSEAMSFFSYMCCINQCKKLSSSLNLTQKDIYTEQMKSGKSSEEALFATPFGKASKKLGFTRIANIGSQNQIDYLEFVLEKD